MIFGQVAMKIRKEARSSLNLRPQPPTWDVNYKRSNNNDTEQMINPAILSPEHKQLLWLGIKLLEPELVDILSSDPNLNLLQKQFNSTIRFNLIDINRFTNAGQFVLNAKEQKLD